MNRRELERALSIHIRELYGTSSSGNYGHAGRPGERGGSSSDGGSSIRVGVSKGFADKTDGLDIEHALILDSNNSVIGAYTGDEGTVKIHKGIDVSNAHIIHNHPGEVYPSLSPQDVAVAIGRNLGSITATGEKGIITLNRPPSGWPDISRDDVISQYNSSIGDYKSIIEAATNKADLTSTLHDATRDAIDKLGLKVSYVKR